MRWTLTIMRLTNLWNLHGLRWYLSSSKHDKLCSFIEYLKLIKSKAKGFVYQLAKTPTNTAHSGKRLIGAIWQTSTMGCTFRLFEDFIGLDMIRVKSIHSFGHTSQWPCVMRWRKWALDVKGFSVTNEKTSTSLLEISCQRMHQVVYCLMSLL